MKQTIIISPYQTVVLASTTYLPLMFWIFPSVAVRHAYMDAQWSVVGLVVMGLISAWLQGLMNERFPTMTGSDMYERVYGKWVGKTLSVLYIPVYLFYVAMCIFMFTLVVKAFFPNTPRWVLITALFLIATRGAWLGVESLGRVASIVHSLTLVGILTIFGFILFQAKRFWLPYTLTSWSATASGIYHLFPLYLGMNFFTMLSPYYQHKKGNSVRYILFSAVFGGAITIVVFFAVVFNLGWETSKQLTFSVPVAIQLVRVPGGVIERLGILIIILASAFTIIFASNYIWGLSVLTARVVNKTDDQFRRFVIPIAICIVVIALLLHSDEQVFELLDRYFVPLSWIMQFINPLITVLIASLRGLRTEPVSLTNQSD